MERDRTIIYVWVFWLSLGIIALWIILRLLGIFESPIWQEMIPYAGAIFAAGSFFQMIFDLRKRINRIEVRQNRMASGLIKLESDVHHLRQDFTNLRHDFNQHL